MEIFYFKIVTDQIYKRLFLYFNTFGLIHRQNSLEEKNCLKKAFI